MLGGMFVDCSVVPHKELYFCQGFAKGYPAHSAPKIRVSTDTVPGLCTPAVTPLSARGPKRLTSKMNNVTRDSVTKEVISFRTNRLNLLVHRQPYTVNGVKCYTKGFHVEKMVNGERGRFPLSEIPKDAEATAELIVAFLMDRTRTIEEALKKFNPRALLRPSTFSTLGELLNFHRESWKQLEISDKTAKGYQSSLLVVLRYVHSFRTGQPFENWSGRGGASLGPLMKPWLDRPVTPALLNRGVADDYQKLMLKDCEDDEDEVTSKITCDTTYRCAKHVFTEEAVKLYKNSSLMLPYEAIADFQAVQPFGTQRFFVLPDMSVIRDIFQHAPALKKNDVNAYRAFVLCAHAGLRKAEVANMRMEWLREEDTFVIRIPTSDGTFKPKHGHGRMVQIEAWVAKELRELAGKREYFLEGEKGERTDQVFHRLNLWQRERGVTATKPVHELRKYWFSQKVKRTDGMTAAKQGGHRDPKITQQCYADSLMPNGVLSFWTEPTLTALNNLGLRIAA